MSKFELSNTIDKNKIFLVNFSEIEGRLDCDYYEPKKLEKIALLKRHNSSIKLRNHIKKLQTGYNNNQNNEDGIKFIRTQNIRPVYLDLDKTTYTKDNFIRVSKYGDILFTRIGVNVGDIAFNDYGDIAISDNVILASLNNPRLAKYVSIVLSTNVGKNIINREKRDTARAIISYENIKKIQIPIFNKDIQQQVIDLYQTAYQTKQSKENEAKKLLAGIDDYLLNELGITLPEKDNSLKNRIFKVSIREVSGKRFDCDYYSAYYENIENNIANSNFEVNKIETVVTKIGGGKTPASAAYSKEKTNFPIIKVGSYTDAFINLKKVDYVLHEGNLKAQKGDIFILSAAHQAEYVGKHIKYLNTEPKIPTSYVGELICVRTDINKCNSMYLFSLLNTDIYKTLLNREKTGQTSHIYGKDIKHIKIPLPDIDKQNEIAEHIKSIREQAKKLQAEAVEIFEQAKQDVEKMILKQY